MLTRARYRGGVSAPYNSAQPQNGQKNPPHALRYVRGILLPVYG